MPLSTSVPPGSAPPANPWREHPLVLEAQLALAGPLGGYGLALDYSVNQWFAVNAGVGAGRAARGSGFGERLQYAITPRFRLPLNNSSQVMRAAIGLEIGLSEGSYREVFSCSIGIIGDCTQPSWSHVLWANTNLALELRQDILQLRFFVGAGSPLAAKGVADCRVAYRTTSCEPIPSGLPSSVFNIGATIGLSLF